MPRHKGGVLMKELGAFFKKAGAKRIWYLVFVIALGVMLMYLGGIGGRKDGEASVLAPLAGSGGSELAKGADESEPDDYPDYGRALEQRLESVLSQVQGAGDVRVVLAVGYVDQVELAEDVTFEKTSEAAENGRLVQSEKRESRHVVITGKDGYTAPVVTKRFEPKIEGAVIVAEGGGNAEVKTSLTMAAGAALNLPAHKIQVLKMDAGK